MFTILLSLGQHWFMLMVVDWWSTFTLSTINCYQLSLALVSSAQLPVLAPFLSVGSSCQPPFKNQSALATRALSIKLVSLWRFLAHTWSRALLQPLRLKSWMKWSSGSATPFTCGAAGRSCRKWHPPVIRSFLNPRRVLAWKLSISSPWASQHPLHWLPPLQCRATLPWLSRFCLAIHRHQWISLTTWKSQVSAESWWHGWSNGEWGPWWCIHGSQQRLKRIVSCWMMTNLGRFGWFLGLLDGRPCTKISQQFVPHGTWDRLHAVRTAVILSLWDSCFWM